MGLTPEEEEIASEYRKMLRMGLPEGAVTQKMKNEGVPQNIQDSVISGDHAVESKDPAEETPRSTSELSATGTDSSEISEESLKGERNEKLIDQSTQSAMTLGSMSYYEEIIEDEDTMTEEEIVDDTNAYEEETVEEVMDDSERADSQTENNGEAFASENPIESDDIDGDVKKNPDAETQEDQVSETQNTMQSRAVFNSTSDVEEQRQPAPYQQQAVEKTEPSPSSCWYWIVCFGLLGLIGAGAGVGYWLTTREGDTVSDLKPLTRTDAPSSAPSAFLSTEFAPVQGSCNTVSNPNPIDQCNCQGEISVLEADVVERYLHNLEHFIPNYYDNYDDDITSCTPRNQALVWISSGNDLALTIEERTQRFALATFYASLGGAHWENSDDWLTYSDISACTWFGVTCVDRYVTQLVLPDNNLVGTLPPEMDLFEKLQFLMVAQNQISGSLPVTLFSVQSLGTIDVGFNSLTGVIPPSVSDAVSLNSLNVENNKMSGRLTRNIGLVSNMGYLNLGSNEFQSELPTELFKLQRLTQLNIGDNQFTGTIPSEFSKLSSLSTLILGPNQFEGTIPTTLGSISKLKRLSILGIPNLTGRIPSEFGFEMDSIEELIISETGIGGNIDTSFGRLPNLKSLIFSGNQLRSVIPTELGNLSNLVTLDLGYNFLDGPIPESLGKLSTLKGIRLSNNLLQGSIPVSFGNLINLKSMRLEANRLEDRVADEICDLRNDFLNVFVVDCPIEIEGELFGVVCEIPECCTGCLRQ